MSRNDLGTGVRISTGEGAGCKQTPRSLGPRRGQSRTRDKADVPGWGASWLPGSCQKGTGGHHRRGQDVGSQGPPGPKGGHGTGMVGRELRNLRGVARGLGPQGRAWGAGPGLGRGPEGWGREPAVRAAGNTAPAALPAETGPGGVITPKPRGQTGVPRARERGRRERGRGWTGARSRELGRGERLRAGLRLDGREGGLS